MTNTLLNIGIRRDFTTLGRRNFEPSGSVQYKSNKDNLDFLGTQYDVGATLPFDVGGVSYSPTAMGLLQLFWNQSWINPLA